MYGKRVLAFGRVKVTMTCVKWRQNVRQFPCGFLRAGNHISGRLYEILYLYGFCQRYMNEL